MTASEIAIRMKPIHQVVDWAKEMSIRDLLGEPTVEYEEYITELLARKES